MSNMGSTTEKHSFRICFLLVWHLLFREQFAYGFMAKPSGLPMPRHPVSARLGDINIGFLTDISTVNATTGICAGIRYSNCESIVLTNLAIDQINNRTDLLPNITLGLVTVDGCMSALLALEVSVYFIKDRGAGSLTCPAAPTPAQTLDMSDWLEPYNVVGIIGPMLSSTAVAVSPLMGIYQIPMISTEATSDDLSDKTTYPYFTRLVAPDSVMAQALVAIAQYYNWSYISVLYSEGAYGENGAAQTVNAIHSIRGQFTICISVSVEIPVNADDTDLQAVADALMSDMRARVVITFLDNYDLMIFPLLKKLAGPGMFLYMAGDSFEGRLASAAGPGSIYVDHFSQPVENYETYLHSPALWVDMQNIWLDSMWQATYNCSLSQNPSKTTSGSSTQQCAFNASMVDNVCTPPTGWAVGDRAYDGLHVFADALHRLIDNNCPEAFNGNKSVLSGCIHGNQLLHYVLNTSINGQIGKIQFTADGNCLEHLVIRQTVLQPGSASLTTIIVGNWSAVNGLSIYDNLVNWTYFNGTLLSGLHQIEPQMEISNIQPILSLCSTPCVHLEYVISKSSPCCWVCAQCRSNEVIILNRTACQACPLYTWPDAESDTICEPIPPVFLTLSNPVSIALICLAVGGIVFSMMVMSVYKVYSQHQLVKATSRELCYIILLGALIVSTIVLVFVVKPDNDIICSIRSVGFNIGINLIYAPLLVKNIRIYRIFSTAQKGGHRPAMTSTKWQILFALIISTIQVVIVISLEGVHQSVSALQMPSLFEQYVELYCNNTSPFNFLLPLSYNILIILICTIIGFATRRLPENFNESWFIFLSAATTLFSWTVFIPAYYTMGSVYLQSTVLGCCLIINSYVTLGCLFGPILYAVAFVPTERIKIVLGNTTTLGQVSASLQSHSPASTYHSKESNSFQLDAKSLDAKTNGFA